MTPPRRRPLSGLLLAAALLLLAEGTARLLSGPPVVPMVVRMPDGSEGLWTEEGGQVRPKLREHVEWWPAQDKQPGRLRLVLLGGSSVAGPPSDERLAANLLATGLSAEVVNLAVSGMDSGHLLASAPGVIALQPDAVIIYSGHNDLGNAIFERRYGDPREVAIARTRAVLGHSRLFNLLEALVGGPEERAVTQHFRVKEVALSESQKAAAIDDFTRRMRSLVTQVQAAGIPVVLSTVVSNPAWSSVGFTCPEALRALGVEPSRTAVMPVSQVDRAALAAAREQSPCVDLDLVAARIAWDEGDRQQAAATLIRLRDEDPLPLRAPSRVNEELRALARQTGATLADTAAAFQERGGGVEPPTWFRDIVHLSGAGNEALAASLADGVAQATGSALPALSWPDPPDLPMSACLTGRCGKGRPPRPRTGPPVPMTAPHPETP
ncbi:SGNH/GDSL hydrolase family protein [Myxococcota bacterium]|nr:SGNH/GDSL hydrolase family protein [Myxococcota bacterium]